MDTLYPNHGMFTLHIGTAGTAPDTQSQPKPVLDVFGDYGGLPLYTLNQDLYIWTFPYDLAANLTDTVIPKGSTVQIIGHYQNNRGDQWFEIGYHQWVRYVTEDIVLGSVETYEASV